MVECLHTERQVCPLAGCLRQSRRVGMCATLSRFKEILRTCLGLGCTQQRKQPSRREQEKNAGEHDCTLALDL